MTRALALLALLALAALPARAAAIGSDTLIVAQGTSVPTIAAAVLRAAPGATIVVRAGEYSEPAILVDRPVTITGEEGARPIITGAGDHQLFVVTADDVRISGLHLRRVASSFVEDRAAIRITGAKRCRVEDNIIEDAFFGVYLARADHCRVADNTFHGEGSGEATTGNAIHVFASEGTTIAGNRITGHRDGIYLEFAHRTHVERNVAERNLRYGLHFMSSDDSRYEANVFRRNRAGAAVMYSRNVTMVGNRFERNWGSAVYGLLLKEVSDSEIRGNRFEGNSTAILADGATRLVAARNEFIRNGWAVRLMASSQLARFEGNNFIGNTFDVSTNSRRSYSTFRGNYWDSYRGYDLDRNGVGDVPHRPVRLFALIVERFEPALILLRSFFVGVLDAAERVVPSLTPEGMVDEAPVMRMVR